MPIHVAFQGVEGAYSEQAARKFFKAPIALTGHPQFAGVFDAVLSKRARYGIIPVENSLAGSIHQNFDLLLKKTVWICGEVKLRVSHSLIVHPGTRMRDIRRVYSHPQALLQCQGFLGKLSRAEVVPYFDTAGSVKFLREEGGKDCAAIASQEAAKRYRLAVLKSGIEDNKENYTRFLVIEKRRSKPRGGRPDKTSLLFALKNVPGALYLSLGAFAARGIQLHKIESRPIAGRPWQYLFYLDFGGDSDTDVAREAIADLKRTATGIKILGSYRSSR